MSKRNLDWTEDKLKRFIKEGRGQGEGINYKPWWTIQDFPSMGRVSRVNGWKTNRIHHFFSDNETNFFYLMEWEDKVIDIREHYPLLDYLEVVDDIDDLRLDKFKDKNTSVDYVIATNFLLTIRSEDGHIFNVARSIKGSSELNKSLSLERLEIERRYWDAKGIDWGIITDKEIDIVKAKNIEWIHGSLRSSEEFGIEESEKVYISSILLERLSYKNIELRELLSSIDDELNLHVGTALYIFKYLIANKTIVIDMTSKIDISKRTAELIKNIRRFEVRNIDRPVNY